MIHYYSLDKIVKNGHDVTGKFRKEPGVLLTTLARPKDLVEFLKAEGINVKDTIQLPDHAGISLEDIPEKAKDGGLLVTEKEYVKIPDEIKKNAACIKSDLRIEPLGPLLDEIVELIETERESETDENL
jgi:tetraacyldisaccharide-1-P 4'-kinase